MACMVAALVLNRPFNYAKLILTHMMNNMGSNRLVMYPRFVQMLIDERYPNLPKNPQEILYLSHTDETTMKKLVKFQKQASDPIAKPLFGYITNANYVAPPENRWRKDGSGDESEANVLLA